MYNLAVGNLYFEINSWRHFVDPFRTQFSDKTWKASNEENLNIEFYAFLVETNSRNVFQIVA
jgi:hypothetical protein